MIELRADGSLPGAPKLARIYKMANDGQLRYVGWYGELETDLPEYISKYPNFLGFVTGFFEYEKLEDMLKGFRQIPFSAEELETEKVLHLKAKFLEAHKAAEKAAHAYFAACPVGEERIRASEIYENIRTAIRV